MSSCPPLGKPCSQANPSPLILNIAEGGFPSGERLSSSLRDVCVCVCSQTPLTHMLCPVPTPHLGTFQGEALWSDGLVGGLYLLPRFFTPKGGWGVGGYP